MTLYKALIVIQSDSLWAFTKEEIRLAWQTVKDHDIHMNLEPWVGAMMRQLIQQQFID